MMSGLTSSVCHQTTDVSRVVSGSKSSLHVHRKNKNPRVDIHYLYLSPSVHASLCVHLSSCYVSKSN